MTHLPYDQILRVMQEGGDPLSQLLKTVKPDTPLALKVVRAADDLENTEALMTLLKAGVVEALTPELVRELSKLVEPLLLEEANRKAATSWSTPSDDRDKKQWVLAEFGDAIAVNGDLVGDDQKIPTPPDDWEPSDIGGRVPVTEIEVSLDGIVRSMAKDLGLPKGVLTPVEDALGRALRSPSNLAYIMVSGETEVYAPPTKDEAPKASNGRRRKKNGGDDELRRLERAARSAPDDESTAERLSDKRRRHGVTQSKRISPALQRLFRAEISNTEDMAKELDDGDEGSIPPATLGSAMESLRSGYDTGHGDDHGLLEQELRDQIAVHGEEKELEDLFLPNDALSNGKKLVCPECGEAAVKRRVRREGSMLGVDEPRLQHTHADGTPLCPVMTSVETGGKKGYQPALPTRENGKKRGKVIQVIREGDDPEIDAYAREVDLKHGMIDRWEARSKKGLCPWCGKKPGPGCKKAKCQDKLQKAGSTLIRKVEKAERRAKSRKKKRAK